MARKSNIVFPMGPQIDDLQKESEQPKEHIFHQWQQGTYILLDREEY